MDHPFVLLVTGPAGSGQTAAAAAWAARQERPTAHVSLDDVRDFVRSGFANPEEGWDERARGQLAVARDACAALARFYVSRGLSCVIDDAIFPLWGTNRECRRGRTSAGSATSLGLNNLPPICPPPLSWRPYQMSCLRLIL